MIAPAADHFHLCAVADARVPESPRVLRAASILGASLDDIAPKREDRFVFDARVGRVTLIVGPSGAGKSMRLRAMLRGACDAGVTVIRPPALPDDARASIDLFDESPECAMRRMARAGLADASCFLRPASTLSGGERVRLRLALAMGRAERVLERAGGRVLLALDEFGAELDDEHARSVASLVRRFVDASRGVGAIVVTTRACIVADLAPDAVMRLESQRVSPVSDGASLARGFVIERGDMGDYDALAARHYRAGSPRAPSLVLRAVHVPSGLRAGVLVVTAPTLNGVWRRVAWPGRYDGCLPRVAAARLNAEVRRIARVVVEPRFRALGLAHDLVRSYLCDPLTVRTEAVAAMAEACPFFERAGMVRVCVPPARRHARLRDALEFAGVPAESLASPLRFRRLASAHGSLSFLDRELRLWADASRASRRDRSASLDDLIRRAARSLGRSPGAWVAEALTSEAEDVT